MTQPIGSRKQVAVPAQPPAAPAAPPAATAGSTAARPVHGADVNEIASAGRSASPEDVARRFYAAFTSNDLATVESLYASDVKFKDMVFEYGDRAGTMKMWNKLLGGGTVKAQYTFDRVEGDVAIGTWTADYKVGGRKVHNVLESRLTVRDGKIVAHQDSSDWSKWARQAFPLGPLVDLKPVKALMIGAIRHFLG